MKRKPLVCFLVLTVFAMAPLGLYSQMGGKMSRGPASEKMGGNRGYGFGYGMGSGMMGGWVTIPLKLPAPQNASWVQKLREMLAIEKQSLAQYESDQSKYNTFMPYVMILPQEQNHVNWIEQLFLAYGLPSNPPSLSPVQTKSLADAWQVSAKIEAEQLPLYEWLVKNAEDSDSAQALNTILLQSRIHLVLFEHAMRSGEYGAGGEWKSGALGAQRGKRGGGFYSGYGMVPGMMWNYNPQDISKSKPIDMKEAAAIVNDYLKATRNPNLKMGKLKDTGATFEAEVLTKNNSLVDRLLIYKRTGWLRSAY